MLLKDWRDILLIVSFVIAVIAFSWQVKKELEKPTV